MRPESHNETRQSASCNPSRFIDEIMAYVQSRQATGVKKPGPAGPVDEDRLLRAALRHLRRNPLPAALMGVSVAWLLLADDKEEDPVPGDAEAGSRIEDEVINQVKGGYAYSQRRLRDLVDSHPLAAAAAIVGGGFLASVLMPEKPRQRPTEPDRDPDPVEDEVMPGEDFGFDPFPDDET